LKEIRKFNKCFATNENYEFGRKIKNGNKKETPQIHWGVSFINLK